MSRSRELKKTTEKKPQTRNKEKKTPRPVSGEFLSGLDFVCSGAKVCRGGCRIAIVGVYRDKSRYLAFAATYRDIILFPR